MSADGFCACGHEWAVHDAYGCCAFLGAYRETKDQLHYCACKVRAPARGGGSAQVDVPGPAQGDERAG
ncbi:MAG: hypothetical protein JWM87_3253 [Candidatus Eremiobacteraeota bacterium]|nr:hypothetical protein [Candidatus Eremiobacteraeota bacterium]